MFSAIFIIGCADTHIVTLKAPVEQLHNLDDYDNDGVIKARDKCAETLFGAAINNNGCGIKNAQIVPFEVDIKFANNSAVIPNSAYIEIKKLAEILNEQQDINILIEGHSSKIGSALVNKVLSDNRAKAVANVLINDFDIDEARVSSIGYGYERLKKYGDSEEVHAENRRIMADLSYTKNVDKIKWTIYTVDEAN
jgi:outer membrane protein OmpA-like peptidoglycan-associated protein